MRRETAPASSGQTRSEGQALAMALAAAVGAAALLSALVWVWVQSAALVGSGRLVGLGLVDAAAGMVALVRDGRWADPASAFAQPVAALLPGALAMYVIAAVWVGWLGRRLSR